MQWIMDHPGASAAIAAGVLLLAIIFVAPERLASVVDQLFQLFGRLVGALAGEAEAGANALFGIVRGVFNMGSGAARTAEKDTTKAAGGTGAAGPAGAPAQEPAAAGQGATPQPTSQDTPFMWVAETVFVRLLYLATVIVVVASDFVFAILRLQAVLFPSLPAPVRDLSFLSLLTGAFFVAIVLLTGALTLDFLNILPPPARLFPDLDDRERHLLLGISLVSFVLSILVVGALFLQGQLLITQATSFAPGAIALATLIGVLQVLVVFLGAWGAIRGLAIILALVGGVVGLVLHLLAVAGRWIADGFDVIGGSILPDVIHGIASLVGRGGARAPRPSAVSTVVAVAGYGDRSSLFTAVLCESIVRMYGRSGLVATGVYADEPSVREEVRSRLARLGVKNISPSAQTDHTPLDTLKSRVLRAYQGKTDSNKLVLWIVDGEKAAQSAGALASLRSEMRDLSVAVLCLLPPGGVRGSDPFGQLKRLAAQRVSEKGEAPSAIIVVDDRSPLYRIQGEPIADQLVARSLSGMLLAPLHSPANPSFVTVLRNLNEGGHAFAALAIDTEGIVTSAASGASGVSRSTGSGSVSPEQALAGTEEVTKRMLTGSPTTTVERKVDDPQAAIYLNFIVPISARTPDFSKYRGLISNWLADTYKLYLYGVVAGQGIDLSETTGSKADRYAQVGVLYGIGDADLPQQPASS